MSGELEKMVGEKMERVREIKAQIEKLENEMLDIAREITQKITEEIRLELRHELENTVPPRTADIIKTLTNISWTVQRRLCTATAMYFIADLLYGVKPKEVVVKTIDSEDIEPVVIGGNINEYLYLHFPFGNLVVTLKFEMPPERAKALFNVFNIVARGKWLCDKGIDCGAAEYIDSREPAMPSERLVELLQLLNKVVTEARVTVYEVVYEREGN